MYNIIIGLIILLTTCYLYLRNYFNYFTQRNIPQEEADLFWGNMKGLGTKYHWHHILERVYKRFKGTGPFCGFYQFFSREILILDPDLARLILIKDFATFADRKLFSNVRDDPLTGNLLQLDGEPWHVLRNKLSPVFTSGKIKYMFQTMVELSERLTETIYPEIGSNGNEIEVKDLFARFTTDVIGRVAFGIDCNSLKDRNAEFRLMGRRISEKPRHSLAVQGFMFAMPDLAKNLRLKNFHDSTIEFFIGVVRQTVEYRQRTKIKCNDFMDLMVELKEQRDRQGGDSNANELSNGLTIEQVAAQAFIFFIAGFDTSSTTMAYSVYELAQNQDIQDKLRTEIKTVLSRHDDNLSYEAVQEMTYLDHVVDETLRKHSVIPFIGRMSTAEYKLPNSDFVIKKGMRVNIPSAAFHKDPEYFPNPEKFDPDRFSSEQVGKRHPYVYLPFGEGPRNCIGKRFGKVQVKVGLVNLLRNFRFDVTPATIIPMPISLQSFLLSPKYDMILKCEKI